MYQVQIAPSVLRLPPARLSVVEAPIHIVDGDELAKVAATDIGLTIIVVLTQVVVLHVPSALTQ